MTVKSKPKFVAGKAIEHKPARARRQEVKPGERLATKAKIVSTRVHLTMRGDEVVFKRVAPHGRIISVTPVEARRAHLIEKEGYDPQFMFEALKKTPVPTLKQWEARVQKANQAVERATTAPFLDKFRLVEN